MDAAQLNVDGVVNGGSGWVTRPCWLILRLPEGERALLLWVIPFLLFQGRQQALIDLRELNSPLQPVEIELDNFRIISQSLKIFLAVLYGC